MVDETEETFPSLTKQDVIVLLSAASAALMARSIQIVGSEEEDPETCNRAKEDLRILEEYLLMVLKFAPSHVLRFIAELSSTLVDRLRNNLPTLN